MESWKASFTHHRIQLVHVKGSSSWRLRHFLWLLKSHETLAQLDEDMAVVATVVDHERRAVFRVVNPAVEIGVPGFLRVSEDGVGKVFPLE